MPESEESTDKGELSEVEKKLQRTAPEIFEGISEPQKEKIIQTIALLQRKTHVGPLPDADTLREYATIIPNGADRIMSMAERQQAHRISLEERALIRQLNQSSTGQWLAFAIGIAALASATYCILEGHEIAGGVIGVGGITGLVTAFIRGKDFQEKDLKAKRRSPNS